MRGRRRREEGWDGEERRREGKRRKEGEGYERSEEERRGVG